MTLTIVEQTRQVHQLVCQCCATPAERTWAFVNRDGATHAVYFASCYHHNGVHEAWIDAIFGNWDSTDFDDHVTFGCRVGPVATSPAPAATLVRGASASPDEPLYGRKLDRQEALAHPRLSEFWTLVDLVLEHDRLVNEHIYGPAE
ncbi:MAG TPA: hypothetical protein VGD43_14430 [Micromonospora sp.]